MVLSMDKWIGKVAVVTGASAGIGAAIVEALVKAGLTVVGLARNKTPIELLSENLKSESGKLYAIKTDITIETEIIDSFKWIESNIGPVSILINNAGVNLSNTLIGGNAAKWRQVLDTNVIGLSVATREAIEQMKKYKIDGHVLHINSVLGHYVAHVPDINIYAASKFAVTALTETLRQELMRKGLKIRVTSVSPGPVESNLIETHKSGGESAFSELFEKMPKLLPEDVADAVVYVLSTPPHVQVQEVMMRPLGEPV